MKKGVQEVQKRTEVHFAVPSRTQTAYFNGFKINACEIRKVISRFAYSLHGIALYGTVFPVFGTGKVFADWRNPVRFRKTA